MSQNNSLTSYSPNIFFPICNCHWLFWNHPIIKGSVLCLLRWLCRIPCRVDHFLTEVRMEGLTIISNSLVIEKHNGPLLVGFFDILLPHFPTKRHWNIKMYSKIWKYLQHLLISTAHVSISYNRTLENHLGLISLGWPQKSDNRQRNLYGKQFLF